MTSINICAELPVTDQAKPSPQRKVLALGLIRYKTNLNSQRGLPDEGEQIRVLGLMVVQDDVESDPFHTPTA